MTNTNLNDDALVRCFLAERREAQFRELYRRHNPVMFRIASRALVGELFRVEDAVQETWLRAVRGLREFRGEASLRTWLVAILFRVVSEQRHERAEVIALDASAPEPEDVAQPPEWLQVDLTRTLALLPPGYRHAIILHDLEGFTHAEIAAALGQTAGTAKSQLSRARRALRALLAAPEQSARRNA
jgi:RNA polymerase sigma-70 factor (ECF subfamily)